MVYTRLRSIREIQSIYYATLLCFFIRQQNYFFNFIVVALKRADCFEVLVFKAQFLSPRILLASWMSLGMMVTLLAWMAQMLVSSNSPTR